MKLLLCTLSIMLLFLNHPMSFGAILMFQTILISMITGTLNYNFWFSYILFLIMIGGLLILFIYMTSIASNEKFKLNIKFLIMIMMSMFMFLLIFIDLFYNYMQFNLSDLINQNNKIFTNLSMTKFMNWPNNLIIYMIIIYLLLTLIAIVKITKIKQGPLRQMN